MRQSLILILAMGTVLLASAQLTSISVEPIITHDGSIDGVPAGYTTYHIHAVLTNEYDFVSAVYGDAENPMSIQCTGDILQVETGGALGQEINPIFFQLFPATEYDSWLTIDAMFSGDGVGIVSTAAAGALGVEAFNDFENGDGFLINDPFGASWFTTFPCAEPMPDLATCADGKIGFAGTDLKVLLAQITTNGDLSGILNVQVFPNGIQADEQLASGFNFSSIDGAVFGCTDANATNYNASATVDDESCLFPCSLELLEASLSVVSPLCAGDNTGSIQIDAAGAQGADDFYVDVLGEQLSNFGNFWGLYPGPHMIYVVDGAGCIDSLEVVIPDGPSCNGCTDWSSCNYDSNALQDDGSCLFLDECGICGGSGIAEGACDCEGNTLDALGVCGGTCMSDNDSNGVCDDQEVYGCSYPLADNFNSSASRDDGSCIFPCEGVVNTNVFDWDGDYVVTVTDFLMMLSVYGDVDVDFDGVWDSGDLCVDTEACNYDVDPSEECAYIDVLGICGGGCEADEDNDGICDDVDTCVGIEDECGVCNGPGPTEVVIESITILYDSVYLPQLEEWYVYEFGADTTFSYTCAPSFSACGDPVSYQGYDYATVLIGDQCWFAENLRVQSYSNGEALINGIGYDEVGAYSEYVAYLGNGIWQSMLECCGLHYNAYAVLDSRKLCPDGWHVPTDEEFIQLEIFAGMSEAEAENTGIRNTNNEGQMLRSEFYWFEPESGGYISGSDVFGFSWRPGGYVGPEASSNSTAQGRLWTSSSSNSEAWFRMTFYDSASIYRAEADLTMGNPVRCIQD